MNNLYWVWLQQALGYGSKYLNVVLEAFGNAESVYKADENAITKLGIGNNRVIERLKKKSLDKAKNIISDCEKNGIEVIDYSSKAFPQYLRESPAPPAVLYAKGNISLILEETVI